MNLGTQFSREGFHQRGLAPQIYQSLEHRCLRGRTKLICMGFNVLSEALPSMVFFPEGTARQLPQEMLVVCWRHHKAAAVIGLEKNVSLRRVGSSSNPKAVGRDDSFGNCCPEDHRLNYNP